MSNTNYMVTRVGMSLPRVADLDLVTTQLASLLVGQSEAAAEAAKTLEEYIARVDELELDVAAAERDITERDDEINDRHNEMMDLRDRLKTAEALASKRLQMIEFQESEIEGLNEFISSVEALVKDQDWYELRVKFGYADVGMALPVTHPEYLETEEDYESAPVGTVVLFTRDEELDRDFTYTKDVSYEWVYEGFSTPSSRMAAARRKVHQWGTGSANGLANGL